MPAKKALLFSIHGVKLGIEIEHVAEVLFNFTLSQPPETSNLVRGFAQVGTGVFPVIRLEQLLHFGQRVHDWKPEDQLHSKILRLKTEAFGFHIDPEVELVDFDTSKLVRIPPEHVLNDCVNHVLAMPPPQPSIIMVEPKKILLSKERSVLRSLLEREQSRLAQLANH